ncbi:bromodomain adjacent to zinc finger domain protein 2B isoform X2 [Denticeps clupeoides]|uniref:bromodomain adjacent to zinc finger domain protein 2B isoform X2 n=1 Tax=Denticeps clupeoides TaxID=299321 RepID=UPI0010A4702A|nr:bromodomain adjacent to zinc finger domain protein 2B isoform X2 [Denticeps clupeoides]
MSAALAAHSQLGAFPDWWRASEAHGRGVAAFFPPLLGLPSLFSPSAQTQSSGPFQARTPSKNGHAAAKGVNGSAVNGNNGTAVSGGSASATSSPPLSEAAKGSKTSARTCKKPRDLSHALEKSVQKPKDKNKAAGLSSDSGSSSDSSSDGVSSSDSDDLEDEDDEDNDQSNDSEDSDSEKEQRVKRQEKSRSEGQKTGYLQASAEKPSKPTQDQRSVQSRRSPDEPPLPAWFPIASVLQSQSASLLFPTSMPREEGVKPHRSVIQATGLVGSAKPLALVTQPRRDSASSPVTLVSSPKPLSLCSSPKPRSVSSSPKPLSLCSSPKPLSLSSSPKPPSLSSSPKPPTLSPPHKPKALSGSPHPPVKSDSSKIGGRTLLDETLLQINSFKQKQPFLYQEHAKQLFAGHKSQKRTLSSSSSSQPAAKRSFECKVQPPYSNHSNLFLTSSLLGSQHPNGVIQSGVQEAPLALITKPRAQSRMPDKPLLAATSPPFSTPINLTMGAKERSSADRAPPLEVPSERTSTSPGLGAPHHRHHKSKGSKPAAVGKGLSRSHLVQSLVDLFRASDMDIPSSKDSDSAEDEDDVEDDEEEEEDSNDSPSDSESILDSDSDVSDVAVKDHDGVTTDTEAERTPLKLTKAPSAPGYTAELSSACTPLNLQVAKAPGIPSTAAVMSSGMLSFHGSPSSGFSLSTPPGSGRRKRVTDERELRTPLELGWQRETHIRTAGGRLQGEVAYYAPCGKKLRQYPDVVKYLARNAISDITRDNFSFSAKIKVGDFYEARDGPQGLQWCLLKEEEVIPRILLMDGRRGRPLGSDPQRSGDGSDGRRRKGRTPSAAEAEFSNAADAKLLRKLEAQEIARQAAQIKLMRKLEKQALARAAKEARKQQAIVAAEEKRRQKEQMKLHRQQEKIKRNQQIRLEKELRAQQMLEAKRKKREEAANAKILEAEKRIKEKEMRRQQAVILKHQERERRRQHIMLMKAVEARKKAEERERLRQEKRDEKRLNKERKLELRRLELEMAREMNKPNEDMCLADHKPLPALPRLPGLLLSGRTFSDCLMVAQFLHSFGRVLGLDPSADVPGLSALQEGLLNVGHSMDRLQDLLVRMLSNALCDPGMPPGHRAKTALGEHLTNVGINRDNVSEILHIYMEAHCGQSELVESLKTKAFQAHSPAQKASILAFLANELACSKSVVSEIDRNIDHMTNLRKEKCVIEGKLRKLRNIYAKRTGRRDTYVGGEETPTLGTPSSGRKRKRKGAESDDDDEEDEDSEDQGDEDDDEEEETKKGKKVETCDDEDEGDRTASVEELEKRIEKMSKQQTQIRLKLFESSHSLRSMMFGQDRYRRRYWVLPQCGGIFVEGMESGESPEELEKERNRLKEAELIQVKEEPLEEKPLGCSPELKIVQENQTAEVQTEKDSLNLFLQKPGSFSKLSKLLEVAKMSPVEGSHTQSQRSSPATVPTTACSPTNTLTTFPSIPLAPSIQPNSEVKPDLCPAAPLLSTSYLSSPAKTSSSPPSLLASDQLFRVLTEKGGHWFSLLPRSPCDDSSLTTSPAQPSTLRPNSPSSQLPGSHQNSSTPAIDCSATSSNLTIPAIQGRSGLQVMALPFCGWPVGVVSPNFPSLLPPLMMGSGCQAAEDNVSPFLSPSAATSKSGSPGPLSDKTPSAPSPVVEASKPQDHPSPQPIPEELLTGWWKVGDAEQLRSLVRALHCRGVRERSLQKQLQKYMDIITQACARHRDVALMDVTELEENQVTEETLETWCVEEQAMEVDIGVLQQVEELERKVTSASLQAKGWMYPEPQSEREDLVYHEHKNGPKLRSAAKGSGEESGRGGIVRHANNPLDIAVTRLAELERNIERRYLKSPLSTTIQIRLDHVGTVTVPAPAPSPSADGEGSEEDIAHGLKVWRKALNEVRSAAQLSLCIQQLQKSIAWERSIMKVYCQICRKGDNEELLLLCDGCDKGCHTYCHRPKITSIPEGDWFCPACISTASGQSLKNKKSQSRTAPGGGKKGTEVKKNKASDEDTVSTSGTPKKRAKEPKKRKADESPATSQLKPDTPANGKKAKAAPVIRDNERDLTMCRLLLADLEGHPDAWPFLTPVNSKSVPGYKKVIKRPMDFSTIREKLVNNQYLNLETFIIDVNLVFDNCEKFNEDGSDIGRAGHSMRSFFERRWPDLLKKMNST